MNYKFCPGIMSTTCENCKNCSNGKCYQLPKVFAQLKKMSYLKVDKGFSCKEFGIKENSLTQIITDHSKIFNLAWHDCNNQGKLYDEIELFGHGRSDKLTSELAKNFIRYNFENAKREKIAAIKWVKRLTHFGLKESKELVDVEIENYPKWLKQQKIKEILK